MWIYLCDTLRQRLLRGLVAFCISVLLEFMGRGHQSHTSRVQVLPRLMSIPAQKWLLNRNWQGCFVVLIRSLSSFAPQWYTAATLPVIFPGWHLWYKKACHCLSVGCTIHGLLSPYRILSVFWFSVLNTPMRAARCLLLVTMMTLQPAVLCGRLLRLRGVPLGCCLFLPGCLLPV